MSAYPSKPWSNGQTAEIVPGQTHVYNSSKGIWTYVTKALLDSDYQVAKAVTDASLAARITEISNLDSDINALQIKYNALLTRVNDIHVLLDSEATRVESNINSISTVFGMIDSDAADISALKDSTANLDGGTF